MDFLRGEIRSKFEYAVAFNRYIKIENGINPISINNNECVNNPYPFAFATWMVVNGRVGKGNGSRVKGFEYTSNLWTKNHIIFHKYIQ